MEQLNCPLLIISCDKYSSTWPITISLIQNYWPSHPKIYFLTEELEFYHEGVINLKVGKNDWATNLNEALSVIKENELFVMLEDFFLNSLVNVDLLQQLIEYFHSTEAVGCLRLWPIPKGTELTLQDLDIYEQKPQSEYRISTQLALWKKEYLEKLLVPGESPWEFEENGTSRSDDLNFKILTTGSRIPIRYLNGLIRGKLTWPARDLLKANGLDFSKLEVMTKWENFYWLKASHSQRHMIDFMRHRFGLLK